MRVWTMKIGSWRTHSGICDASGAVLIGPGSTRFLVANDEDTSITSLRLYDAAADGSPLATYPLDSEVLKLDPDEPEMDLEASAWLGERIWWIGSHSRSKRGKPRPSRQRLFATRMESGVPVISGQPYCHLLRDVSRELGLDLDNGHAPKDGGLSIEGLAAMRDMGGLLIGLRSPLLDGKALLISLLNAPAVVDGGADPRFGEPSRLDLGGLGIRSIDYWSKRRTYLILAGPPGGTAADVALLSWSGSESDRPHSVEGIPLGDIVPEDDVTPEALMICEKTDTIYILLDEGNRRTGGLKCKDAAERSFRSIAMQVS